MTALQSPDTAEAQFLAHCRASYEAPSQVFGHDASAIERIAKALTKAADLISADIADSRSLKLDFPACELAERLAEAIDLPGEQGQLLSAHLRYLARAVPVESQAKREAA